MSVRLGFWLGPVSLVTHELGHKIQVQGHAAGIGDVCVWEGVDAEGGFHSFTGSHFEILPDITM